MDFKKLAIIGGSLVGAGALFYYFYNNSKVQVQKASGKDLPREVIISTLKQLKKELFTVCVQMSLMANEMKRYSQGRLDYDIKDFIFSYSSISQEIQASIKKAYDKNNVTEADFQYNCEVTFAADSEIQTMMKGIKSMVDNAAEGKQMDIQAEIPEFLTQEKLLEIIEKIMIETTKSMQQLFMKIKEQYGELNLNDPRIQRSLQSLKTDEIKDNIFNQYNLEDFEDPASKIIQCATQKYAMEHPEFQEKMVQLELKQRKSMEIIMQNPEKEGAVDEIFNEPSQPMGGMGMGGMGGGFPGFHSSKRKNQSKEEKKEEAAPVQQDAKVEETKTEVAAENQVEEKQEVQQPEQEKKEGEVEVAVQENKEEQVVVEQKNEENIAEQEKKEEEANQVNEQVDVQQSVEVVHEKSEEQQQQQQESPEHQE